MPTPVLPEPTNKIVQILGNLATTNLTPKKVVYKGSHKDTWKKYQRLIGDWVIQGRHPYVEHLLDGSLSVRFSKMGYQDFYFIFTHIDTEIK